MLFGKNIMEYINSIIISIIMRWKYYLLILFYKRQMFSLIILFLKIHYY